MSNILITGGCGMVGSHLIEFYFSKGIKPVATYFTPTIDINEVADKCEYHLCDVKQAETIGELIETNKPTIIYHLAAQSYPALSWDIPIETFETNVNGTVNVFEAIKKIRMTDATYDPVVVVACSSAQYGSSLTRYDHPVTEDAELLPLHPYGVSKVSQDLLAYQYFATFGIRTIRARIFNTTGVRKVNDVVSDFTKRAVMLEKGQATEFTCGNLYTKRAITDVRDLITALMLLAEKGTYGEAYNISGDNIYEMKDIVEKIEAVTGRKLDPKVDPSLIRPKDEPVIYGNSAKLKAATGWKQTVSLDQTIADMIAYWRRKL
ncbi:MAG: GDP-D-mannose dehydratase [Flavipsychrobacter sp.]|jgi:nucleoside-diphosphate-sugar epimerase|nr:GDP-D-mannose dehydratase [Flavipsychrobacter sp.]